MTYSLGGTRPPVAVTLGLLQSLCAVTPSSGAWGDSRPSQGASEGGGSRNPLQPPRSRANHP